VSRNMLEEGRTARIVRKPAFDGDEPYPFVAYQLAMAESGVFVDGGFKGVAQEEDQRMFFPYGSIEFIDFGDADV